MSAELKPCPFCGGDAEFSGPSDADTCWVQCTQCKTRGRLWDYGYQAEKAWNARAEASAFLAPIEGVCA